MVAVPLRAVVLGLAATAVQCVVRIELSRAGRKLEAAKESGPPTSSIVSLDDQYDMFAITHVATVTVGTPGQALQVAFSLHNTNTWVPGAPPLAADASHAYYTPSASSTYERVDRILSTGSVEGEWARDVVSIGSLRMEGFEFGVAEKSGSVTTGNVTVALVPTQGSMGLGLSDGGGVPVVLRELVKTEQIPAPIFAFHFGEDGGDLSLGGPAEDRYEGDFHFVGLANASAWSVAIDGVQYGHDAQWMEVASGPAYLSDTLLLGVIGIFGPDEIITPFLKEWEAAGATNTSGMLLAPCDTPGPSLHFKIGGRNYTLGPEDLLVGSGTQCVVPVSAVPAQEGYRGEWLLGLPFLKKYYTQFDAAGEKRIGFALARRGADNFV